MNVLWIRFVDRVLIAAGGILCICLGFVLYRSGVNDGQFEFSFQRFVINGQGPGLAFAAAGAVILIFLARSPGTVDRSRSGDKEREVITLGEIERIPEKVLDEKKPRSG